MAQNVASGKTRPNWSQHLISLKNNEARKLPSSVTRWQFRSKISSSDDSFDRRLHSAKSLSGRLPQFVYGITAQNARCCWKRQRENKDITSSSLPAVVEREMFHTLVVVAVCTTVYSSIKYYYSTL